jgi:polyether ionophore transport system permease protein
MLRITWRMQRFGLVAVTLLMAFYGLFQTAAYKSAAGSTQAQRIAFGHEMEVFGRQLTYLLPVPQHMETIGAYLQWRVFGALPFLFIFWVVLSASGAFRGDEDKGLIEQWRSAGVDASRYTSYRFVGFLLTAVVVVAGALGAIQLGALTAGPALDWAGLVELGIALLGLTACSYAAVMVVAQLTSSRGAAAGIAAGVLAVMFFVNSFSRTVDSLRPIASVISPFYYYDRTTPLYPGGSFDVWGTVGLYVTALALAAFSAYLFGRRDLGSQLVKLPSRTAPETVRPSSNRLLRAPVLALVYQQRWGLVGWTVGALAGAAYLASIGRTMVDTLIKGSAGFSGYLKLAGGGDPYVTLVGFFWFGVFVALLAIYAIVQVSHWSSDDSEGRLETVLSAPVSRTRVVLERAAALLLGTLLIVTISGVGFYLSAHAAGIDITVIELLSASVPLLPFALSFAAVGALVASRVPRVAVSILVALAFVSWVVTEGGPLLKLPDWIIKLSVFSLYGEPLVNGIYWNGFWALLALTIVGFGAAALLMQRRDVGA